MKTDVWCIGAAVVDITATPVGIENIAEEKQRINSITMYPGGDALNQSIRLADAGVSVSLIAGVGKDTNASFLRKMAESRGVDISGLAENESLPTGTSLVLVDGCGQRHVFSVKSAHSELDKKDLPDINESSAPKAVSIASLLILTELEKNGFFEFLSKAKSMGALIFADLSHDKFNLGLDGIKRFLPLLDYFLPSEADALKMTGKDKPEEAAKVYYELGAKNVIIKCGERGCFYLNEKDSGWVDALKVETVDTTGAGDCMVAQFISRILAGDDIRTACEYANRKASISTKYMGASDVNIG